MEEGTLRNSELNIYRFIILGGNIFAETTVIVIDLGITHNNYIPDSCFASNIHRHVVSYTTRSIRRNA